MPAVSPPSISIGNLTANETKHVSLNCTVSGHPSPSVTWFKAGKLLETKVLSSLSECSSRLNDFYLHVYASELGKPRTHSLVICNANYHNSGWYTCKARNGINETDGKAYLNVQGTMGYISTIHVTRDIFISQLRKNLLFCSLTWLSLRRRPRYHT